MDHQIHALLKVSLENIKNMLDVDTIVGETIRHENYSVIPISKIRVNFLSGGSEFNSKDNPNPFGGATGGSVSVSPVAFLVLTSDDAKLLQIGTDDTLYDKIVEILPEALSSVKKYFNKAKND